MKESKELEIITVPQDEKGAIEIVPFGTDERIKLSVSIVQKMIAVPTRTGKVPDAAQCIKFMMLCKARHLNPFEGDCYMLGYDAQSGPQFSMITAHQVFLKRAEASKGFDGMQSGVIVSAAGTPIEREGDILYADEQLLGGWAKVYRKDRQFPFYKRLKLSTFNTGKSRWEKDPSGMIVKCAEADALRTAFPTHLGGLYLDEEMPPIDIGPVIERAKVPKVTLERLEREISAGNNIGIKGSDEPEPPAETPPPPAPVKKKPVPLKRKSRSDNGTPPNQKRMLEILAVDNRTTDELLKVAVQNEWCSATDTWPLDEEKLELFLDPENLAVLVEDMDQLSLRV